MLFILIVTRESAYLMCVYIDANALIIIEAGWLCGVYAELESKAIQ